MLNLMEGVRSVNHAYQSIGRKKTHADNIPEEFKRKYGSTIINGVNFPNGGFTTVDFVNENPDMFKTAASWDAKIIRCNSIITNFIKGGSVIKLGSHPRSSGGILNYYSVAPFKTTISRQLDVLKPYENTDIKKILDVLTESENPGDPDTLFDHISMIDDNCYNINESVKTLIELIDADNGHFKRCFAELIAIQKKQLLLFEQLSKKQQSD